MSQKLLLTINFARKKMSFYLIKDLPSELRKLVAETILIDTANFSPNQLVDDLDRDEYEWSISGLSEWDRENVYSDITKARFDISGLSPRELLLKDAKFVTCKNKRAIFSSTLHCDLEDFFNTPGVFEDLKVPHHIYKLKT